MWALLVVKFEPLKKLAFTLTSYPGQVHQAPRLASPPACPLHKPALGWLNSSVSSHTPSLYPVHKCALLFRVPQVLIILGSTLLLSVLSYHYLHPILVAHPQQPPLDPCRKQVYNERTALTHGVHTYVAYLRPTPGLSLYQRFDSLEAPVLQHDVFSHW